MQVLISHAVEDEPAATALKEMIRRCSLNKVDVWFSSDRSALGGMPIGGPWFSELHGKLKATDWIIALLTPQSISSPWLYFECGFGACSRSHSVVPLALGLPVSAVPMPLAAYQIYDSTNALSLATFLHKLLAADGILYDEEMTRTVRESTQRRMIEHQDAKAAATGTIYEQTAPAGGEIARLQSFIERRFVELYDMLPSDKRPKLNLELTFDASEIVSEKPAFTLNIPSGASVMDVLNEIYFRIEDYVRPYTYLVDWTILDTKSKGDMSIIEITERVPANLVFSSDRQYKLVRLHGGDDYIKLALHRTRRTFMR